MSQQKDSGLFQRDQVGPYQANLMGHQAQVSKDDIETKTTVVPHPSSERTRILRERMLASPVGYDIERARCYTRVWEKMGSEGDKTPCMRAALALEETLRNRTIWIDEDEQLVGTRAKGRRTEPIGVERELVSSNWLTSSGTNSMISGNAHSARYEEELSSMPEEDRKELAEVISPFWQGKTLHDLKIERWINEGIFEYPSYISSDKFGSMMKKVHELIPGFILVAANVQGHVIPGWHNVLEFGFHGISNQAQSALENLQEEDQDYHKKKDFLESVMVAAKAVCDFSNRYAELAEKMASEQEGDRKLELLQIAERCRRVPAEPARTFIEALQSYWMTSVILAMSYGVDHIYSAGRVDQYLYPYYTADIEAGRITREQVLEALEELIVQLSGNRAFGPNNLTIGGVDKEGNDVVNDLSYMIIDAFENLKGMASGLAVRISPKTPRDFLIRAIKTYRSTAGVALYNDEVVIKNLEGDGYSLEAARNYSIVGCVELTGTGDNYSSTAGMGLWLVGLLEAALNQGRRMLSGDHQAGAKTPDPKTFQSFEDVKQAFETQVSFAMKWLWQLEESRDRVFADLFPVPLLSSTIDGCIASGHDATRGGAQFNNGHVGIQGLATVANSLAAIRWAVFEERIITMEELMKAVRQNFSGYESLQQRLIRKAPKYGNDDPRADELAEWVTEVVTREARKYKSFRGGNYRVSMVSARTHTLEGTICRATPDGRLAGQAVSNGMSPTNGTEQNGATAVFNSVARASKANCSDGTALNMNLSPFVLETDEKVEKLADMILVYFEQGGRHIQFNPMDAATLRDAQAYPEKYTGLTVKVSGYSFYFVDLSKPLQDDIIARTEFCDI